MTVKIITLCAGCAEKLREVYELSETGGERELCQCPLCFGVYRCSCYELGMSHRQRKEWNRKRTAQKNRGGGERSRAGRG